VPPFGLRGEEANDIPYTTLAQAFQTLVHQILVKSEAELDQWRSALREAVEPNGQLMVNLTPELEFISGKQPPVPDLPAEDAQNRFQMVFRRFLGCGILEGESIPDIFSFARKADSPVHYASTSCLPAPASPGDASNMPAHFYDFRNARKSIAPPNTSITRPA
jgi:hypothetical protein